MQIAVHYFLVSVVREGVGGKAKHMASQRWCLCLVQLDKKAMLPCVKLHAILFAWIEAVHRPIYVCKQDCYCSFATLITVELVARLEKTLAE